VNNITKVQNLQRCESLQKLDLTVNFVPKAGLLSLPSLRANPHLCELYLLGNPCADWHGYRQFIVARLPQLKKLVGGRGRGRGRGRSCSSVPGGPSSRPGCASRRCGGAGWPSPALAGAARAQHRRA
jgi:hypothetical protein